MTSYLTFEPYFYILIYVFDFLYYTTSPTNLQDPVTQRERGRRRKDEGRREREVDTERGREREVETERGRGRERSR